MVTTRYYSCAFNQLYTIFEKGQSYERSLKGKKTFETRKLF